MLIWREEKPPQTELLRVGANDWNPRVRIQALSTLAGLGLMTPDLAFFGLGDRHPAVKEFAVRLSEPFLRNPPEKGVDRNLANALLQCVNDASIRVRYQLAFTLGEWDDPRAGKALAQIALKDRGDPVVQTAVLSSAKRRAAEILDAILADTTGDPPPDLLAHLLALVLASHDQASAAKTFDRLGRPDGDHYAAWQLAGTAAFLDALERHGRGLTELHNDASPELKNALDKLDGLFVYARETTESAAAGDAERLPAIRLLGRGPASQQEDAERLGGVLRPQFSSALQQAALDRLKEINRPQVGRTLVAGWKTYGPSLRAEVLNALLGRQEWTRQLLAALQSGVIAAGEISPVHQQRLIRHSDPEIRAQTEKLFAARDADRQKVIEQYTAVNRLTGNAERGAALYRQNCAACHRLKGEGANVGPDLGTVADKPVGTLLAAILDPNQAFETRYINYTTVTRGGRELSGIIAAETPNSITLRNAAVADETILRGDIKELTSSRLSLMPEGFENILKPQEMADLIAYIRSR
jgi:putative heme-binding domain-containing protein